MHHKFIYSHSGEFWVSGESAGIVTTPQNVGFDPLHIIGRLEAADVHTHEVLNADALSPDERGVLYLDAITAAGKRYTIRQVWGSRKFSGMGDFGLHVPALLVYDGGRSVDVFPHPVGDDGTGFATIRGYADAL